MSNELVVASGDAPRPAMEVIVPHRIKFLSRAGKEMLTICDDGRFLVKGREVAVDQEVYDTFCDWLSTTTGKNVGNGLLLNDDQECNEKGQLVVR